MLIEHGLHPEIPGMEVSETLIEEELRYNPECPCRTRTCPQHGFCKYCVQHHCDLVKHGPKPPPAEKSDEDDGSYQIDHSLPVCKRVPRKERARGKERSE